MIRTGESFDQISMIKNPPSLADKVRTIASVKDEMSDLYLGTEEASIYEASPLISRLVP